ncbi:helix-turn-helix domain-containing protein [Clostridium grantii]|uniref:Helix-turn-helix domain-containing protein n=1 Tax=Clostridium grantii DSM 8605 TaxID=1121316 RepID=A0A1M5WKN7_9CLOT|nr:AraC family transcriptional regulator [Clostridium grantii]SHH88002.1 Helix-turn-helix domain-containing protein [Clostridium grantii DSM 8605]
MERIRELKNYKTTNPYLKDIFLYYCGDEYIVTSTGTAPIKMFMDGLFNYEKWDNEDFLDTINNNQITMVRPVESVTLGDGSKNQYSTIIYPLSSNSREPYAMLLFVISKDFFDSKINTVIDNHSKITIIINDNNEIIVSSRDETFLKTNDFLKLVESPHSLNRKVVELDNEKYIAAYVQSEDTGWKYITLTPKINISEKIKEVRIGFFIGIILVIFIGFLAIFISMHINYNPIKQLKKYSQSIISDFKESTGELDLVKKTIDFLSHQNALLSDEVEHSNEANKQYITMQFLRGSMTTDKKLEEKARKYGVYIEASCTVAIIYIDSKIEYALTRKEIIDELKKDFLDGITIYTCENVDYRKIIMILSFKEQQYVTLQDKFKFVQKSIREKWNVSTVIGIGNCYHDKQFVPKAYIEASTAVDYRLVKGHGCVISFSKIIEQQGVLENYPQNNLMNIAMLLKNGSMKAIEEELDNISNYIKNNNTPIFIARGLCFDIINLIFQTSKGMVSEFHNNDLEIPDVFTLAQFDTVDELVGIVKDLSRDLCSQIIKQKEKEELSIIHEMIAYIKNNYTECNFSLLGMADFFNMSQSSLSMYFKDKTDKTILSYITEMKMEKAKELLITTDIPLSELSEAVGYSNVTSFIRRFKQWENITPGDYRKKYTT